MTEIHTANQAEPETLQGVISIPLSFSNHNAYGAFDVEGQPVLIIAPPATEGQPKGEVPNGSVMLAFTDPASISRVALVLNGLVTAKAQMVQQAQKTLQQTAQTPALEHQGASEPSASNEA